MKTKAAPLLSDLWARSQRAVIKANTATQWPQVITANIKRGVYELPRSSKEINSIIWMK